MYDVIFLSDIYVPGGTNFQLAKNIRLLKSLDKRVGLIPTQLPHARGAKPINRFVREEISSGHCEVIVPASQKVHCHLFAIDNPRLLAEDVPVKIEVGAARHAIQVPFPVRNGAREATFDPSLVTELAESISYGAFRWAPVSNLVRQQLRKEYPELTLTERNAHPIVDVEGYRFNSKIRRRDRVALGRHSRPEKDKWPDGRAAFLKVYPDADPFAVSLLGIDPASLEGMIGGPVPTNYTALPYDSVKPSDFLSTIDFFVYYHSKSWIEAFGIVIAEAMAAGALCVLPPYMRENFGEAAIYAVPGKVKSELIKLHRNERAYAEQTRWARRHVQQAFSQDNFQALLAEFDLLPVKPKERSARIPSYDSVYAADFTSEKVFNRAFFDAALAEAEQGRKVALLDLQSGDAPRAAFARSPAKGAGLGIVPAGTSLRCDRLIINDPIRAESAATDLDRLRPKETVLLASYPHGEPGKVLRYLARFPELAAARAEWAPGDTYARMWLEGFDPNLILPVDNWRPVVSGASHALFRQSRSLKPETARLTIGFLGTETDEDVAWMDSLFRDWQDNPLPIATYYGEKPPKANFPPAIVRAPYGSIDLLKWLAKLDRLVVVRDKLKGDNLDYAVEICRAGIPVIYRWRGNKERSPDYLEGLQPAEARERITRPPLPELPKIDERPKRALKRETARPTKVHAKMARPTLLFVSQNGTGVGHVVRQLAIARKLCGDHDCIFLTMSQALRFISAFGFHAEYFPSAVYSGVSYTDWLHWLRKKVDMMIDAWSVRTIVFDGNVPYAAVAEAAAARADVRSAWIRRGMWPDSEVDRKRLSAQFFFDMVIEPGDFAEEYDTGPTRPLRDTVRLVPPVQLLENDELASRAEACRALGIDAKTTNVLVQLGSGNNRDTQSMLRRIAAALEPHPHVKPYNLRWPISDLPPLASPGISELAVFPMSRFYRAFDFSISAAGYNTAHEVLCYGLPTIFVPNETEGMDNQAGRATFSAARGLSLNGKATAIGTSIARMLEPDFRKAMRAQLRRLHLENGAAAAAQHIDALSRMEA
jgi:UDP:flavonoid glycosyltransferase YjiC (YdhE family)